MASDALAAAIAEEEEQLSGEGTGCSCARAARKPLIRVMVEAKTGQIALRLRAENLVGM